MSTSPLPSVTPTTSDRLDQVLSALPVMDPGEAGLVVQRLLEQLWEERAQVTERPPRIAVHRSRASRAREIVRKERAAAERDRNWACEVSA